MHGLSLVLKSDLGEYLPTSQNSAMRLALHTPYQAPLPDFRGFTVSPGTYVDIKLQYENIKRINVPPGSCTDKKPPQFLYNSSYEKEVSIIFSH